MKREIDESSLNSLLRLEIKNVDSLEQVSPQFYKEVRDYLEGLRNKIDIEAVKKNSRQIGRLMNELENSEKLFRRIIDIRISKILRAKAKNVREELEGRLTPEELVFFENIVGIVKEFSDQLERGKAIIPLEEKQEEVVKEVEKQNEEDYVTVYVLNEIKGVSIMGKPVDLKKEDIVTLPRQYAEIIIKQGYGKKLEHEDPAK
jgi:DNA replication initiation complex subunit (GINS family)